MNKKILIIDDDRDFVEILRANLEKRGYTTSFAYSGREGLEKGRSEKPDLVTLEIMLPEVGGYRISRLLKFDIKYKNIPIIISSSRCDAAALSREAGADACVVKSTDVKELVEKIELMLK